MKDHYYTQEDVELRKPYTLGSPSKNLQREMEKQSVKNAKSSRLPFADGETEYVDIGRGVIQDSDPVTKPPHYTQGDIETIDYIRDKLTDEEFVGYCKGNVLKYISREKYKNGTEDLKKAQVYLGWAIGRREEK